MGGGVRMNRDIPSSTLATLRGILVSSLSKENLGPNDISSIHEQQQHIRLRPPRKVHFREGVVVVVVVVGIYREIRNSICFEWWEAFRTSNGGGGHRRMLRLAS
ncbi:hypothetical protein M0804_002311 [Polistes exclamans]|nr:hypothetical protein M0804_002311 [Polistes exclamans]